MKILYRIRTKRTQKNCPSNASNLENNISLWAFSSPQSVVEHSHSLAGDMNMPGFCQVVFLIIMQTPHTRGLIYRFPSQCGQTPWLKKELDCLNKSSLQWAGSAPLALKEREGFYNYLNKINSIFSIKLKKIWIISPHPLLWTPYARFSITSLCLNYRIIHALRTIISLVLQHFHYVFVNTPVAKSSPPFFGTLFPSLIHFTIHLGFSNPQITNS